MLHCTHFLFCLWKLEFIFTNLSISISYKAYKSLCYFREKTSTKKHFWTYNNFTYISTVKFYPLLFLDFFPNSDSHHAVMSSYNMTTTNQRGKSSLCAFALSQLTTSFLNATHATSGGGKTLGESTIYLLPCAQIHEHQCLEVLNGFIDLWLNCRNKQIN